MRIYNGKRNSRRLTSEAMSPSESSSFRPKQLPVFARILVAFVSLVILVMAIELLLHVTVTDLSYQDPAFALHPDIGFPQVYQKNSRRFWQFRPGITVKSRLYEGLEYSINDDGRRGPPTPDRGDCFRILTLGNSCTFGWGVSDHDTWPRRLEAILNEEVAGRCIQVVNGGIPGYSSFQGKTYFKEELVGLAPDYVLIMFGWNDHRQARLGIPDSEQHVGNPVIVFLQNHLSQLRLYQFMRKTLLPLTEAQNPVAPSYLSGTRRVSREEFFDNLEQIIKTARNHEIEPILLIPPIASSDNYFDGAVTDLGIIHQTYQKEIVRVSQYNSVPLIDLQPVFDERADLYNDAYSDAMHFNERGQQLTAQVIAEHLLSVITQH